MPQVDTLLHPLTFLALALEKFNRDKGDILTTFFTIAWGIWGGRNKQIYAASNFIPRSSIQDALIYQGCFVETLATPLSKIGRLGCWKPLECGFSKLNVDGALFRHFCMVVIGAIIKNSHGGVLFAASIKEQDVQDSEIIENLAILYGLQLSMHLRVTHIIVETDCNSVVQEIHSSGESTSNIGNLIHITS